MAARADGVGRDVFEGDFDVDKAVIDALPVRTGRVLSSHAYGMWVWARQAKITVQCNDEKVHYFLKVTTGENDKAMIQGQYESDKAIHEVSPLFCPRPYAWGQYKTAGTQYYFLLSEFRTIGQQPPEPIRFTQRLAECHKKSKSPNGLFGFHTVTCHGKATQSTDSWDASWTGIYSKLLEHALKSDQGTHEPWPEYDFCARLVVEKCIPMLLDPLQSGRRVIKPCLVHGNIWDENTATDMATGEPFVFDGSSLYAHNEYELGNWRSPRHRLSSKTYVKNYKRYFPASEPEEDWDSRNLLYSLRFNITAGVLIPGNNYRDFVFKDLKELCRRVCPTDLAAWDAQTHGTEEAPSQDNAEDTEEEEEEEEEEDEA
ncbi:MAG: hypothetical protein M1828_003433 [Chrysothrix sp. TS-e1954]|nr:MAG: hypothetical protein M1828_003433 [Chrysothrix sp. TS-e1954]